MEILISDGEMDSIARKEAEKCRPSNSEPDPWAHSAPTNRILPKSRHIEEAIDYYACCEDSADADLDLCYWATLRGQVLRRRLKKEDRRTFGEVDTDSRAEADELMNSEIGFSPGMAGLGRVFRDLVIGFSDPDRREFQVVLLASVHDGWILRRMHGAATEEEVALAICSFVLWMSRDEPRDGRLHRWKFRQAASIVARHLSAGLYVMPLPGEQVSIVIADALAYQQAQGGRALD